MSTQSYPAMADRQIVTDGKETRPIPPPPGKATSSSGGVYGPSDTTNRTSSGRSGKCVRFALQ